MQQEQHIGGGAQPPPGRQASLTREQRQAIIGMHAQGTKPRVIAAQIGCEYAAVRCIVHFYRRRGKALDTTFAVTTAGLIAAFDAGRVPPMPVQLLRTETEQAVLAITHIMKRDGLTAMQVGARLGMNRGRVRAMARRHPCLAPPPQQPRAPAERKPAGGPRQTAAVPEIRRLRAEGMTVKAVAKAVRLSVPTVRRLIAEHAVAAPARARAAPRIARTAAPSDDRPSRLQAVGRYAKPTTRHPPAALSRPEPIAAPLPAAVQAAVADAAVARRYADAMRMIARQAAPSAVMAATRLPLREVFRLQSTRRSAA